MTVISPILSLLGDSYSRNNYRLLSDLSKNYSTRYLKKSEQKALTRLVLAYKAISQYDSDDANADILRSYFEDILRKNGVNPRPVPVEYEGEIVYYDYPPDMNYLSDNIKRTLQRNDPDFESYECESAITAIFNHYCKECYGIKEPLPFFKDYRLPEVLMKSEVKKKWDERFAEMQDTKKSFFELGIAKRSTMS